MSEPARSIPRVSEKPEAIKETRNERFRRLATKRVGDGLKRLDRIGELASPNPAYSKEEAARIIDALRDRVDAVERRLLPTNSDFKFD